MNSSGFAMAFGGDQFWIDGNVSAIAAFALDQRRLDGAAMWVECVENTIECVLRQVVEIAPENVGPAKPDAGVTATSDAMDLR